MSEKAHGYVVRTRLLTETSLIVHWLTRDHGRVATVAKGARRPKSPFRGKLDLFHEADFSFVRARRSDLHGLREIQPVDSHADLRLDLTRLRQASYAVLLIEQVTETETPLRDIYEIFDQFIKTISEIEPAPESVLAFEVNLLNKLGFRPDLKKAHLSDAGKAIFNQWQTETPSLQNERLEKQVRIEIARYLQAFMIYHLGKVPKLRSEALK